MQTDQYTPDAICRSLGLKAFDEPWEKGRPSQTLRVLLTPSFDPELCIDAAQVEGGLQLSIVSARTHIWRLPVPGHVVADRCEVSTGDLTFDDLEQAYRASFAAKPEWVVLDGMPVHAVLRRHTSTISISDNPVTDSPLGSFAAMLIDAAFTACEQASCRNALARAGRYVGLKLPIEPSPEPKPLSRLQVLGSGDDQAELLAALEAVSRRKPGPPV